MCEKMPCPPEMIIILQCWIGLLKCNVKDKLFLLPSRRSTLISIVRVPLDNPSSVMVLLAAC